MTDNNEPKGRAKGGKARAEKLTSEQLIEIAKKGAIARWGAKVPQATHKGNFKDEFGIDVECYVLNDANKTAVISQIGMGRTLGLSSRGNAFPRFLSSKAMMATLGAELREKLSKPVKFQWGIGGAGLQPPNEINGFDATLLIDVCKSILQADDAGLIATNQQAVVKQANIILGASAKAGIQGIVYALSGYDRTKEEIITSFKLYVQEEARKYEREFPPELYTEWYRLYEIPVLDRGKPWHFKHLTVKHIYYPLAKSNGKILELIRALKSDDGDRKKKLFQFLNEIGARALGQHIGRVREMAESAKTKTEYENKISERFGGQQELDF